MKKTGVLTRILAVVGALLVWFPLLLPIAWALVGMAAGAAFDLDKVDYVLPIELSPLMLLGWVLLFWVALRARARRRLIVGGLVLAGGPLLIGYAVVSALGRVGDELGPTFSWEWALLYTTIACYILGFVVVGVAGVLLVRDILRPGAPGAGPALPLVK